jgi:hypothetical protein
MHSFRHTLYASLFMCLCTVHLHFTHVSLRLAMCTHSLQMCTVHPYRRHARSMHSLGASNGHALFQAHSLCVTLYVFVHCAPPLYAWVSWTRTKQTLFIAPHGAALSLTQKVSFVRGDPFALVFRFCLVWQTRVCLRACTF